MKRLVFGLCVVCVAVVLDVSLSRMAFGQDPPPPQAEASAAAPAAGEPAPPPPGPKPLDRGDNAWMLTSSALVLLMTAPGLAMFYGGLVRKKNVLERHDAVLVPDGPDDRHLGDCTAIRSRSAIREQR